MSLHPFRLTVASARAVADHLITQQLELSTRLDTVRARLQRSTLVDPDEEATDATLRHWIAHLSESIAALQEQLDALTQDLAVAAPEGL